MTEHLRLGIFIKCIYFIKTREIDIWAHDGGFEVQD